MIEERRGAVIDFFAGGTCLFLNGELLNLLLTVLAHKVENPIRLRQGLVGTTGTLERGRILFRVFRGHMDGESLGVEKLLLTCGTGMREMPLVLLHMVMHRVLVLFDLRTDGTDKLAGGILLINIRHVYLAASAVAGFNFCGGLQQSRSVKCHVYLYVIE